MVLSAMLFMFYAQVISSVAAFPMLNPCAEAKTSGNYKAQAQLSGGAALVSLPLFLL